MTRGRHLPPGMLVFVVGAILLLVTPLVALLLRTPWRDLGEILGRPVVREALGLSLATAGVATVLCVLLGTPLALFLADRPPRSVRLLRALVLLPMVLPPVVGGVALLEAFGRRGLLGDPLDAIGVRLPFTPAAVVLAQTFVALPFFVVTVEAGLRNVDPGLREAADVMGARPWLAIRRIVLPLVWSSVLAGAALAFARGLGEFGATITFAGNLGGRTQTMPLAIVDALRQDPAVALVLSVILVAASLAVLVGLRGRWLSAVDARERR